jgi:hypothetical protein
MCYCALILIPGHYFSLWKPLLPVEIIVGCILPVMGAYCCCWMLIFLVGPLFLYRCDFWVHFIIVGVSPYCWVLYIIAEREYQTYFQPATTLTLPGSSETTQKIIYIRFLKNNVWFNCISDMFVDVKYPI